MSAKTFAIAAALLMTTSIARAQDLPAADSGQPHDRQDSREDAHDDAWPHPALSADDGWAGKMLWITLLGFFVPAAIIGPWIRKRMAGELPELHDREEQSGLTASQHEPGHTRPPASSTPSD